MKKGFNKVFSCAMAFIFAFGMTPTLPAAMADEAKTDETAVEQNATAEDQAVAEEEAADEEAAVAVEDATSQNVTLTNGTYSVDVASSMGMLKPMTGDESSYIEVKDDKAYLVFNATSTPDKNGAVKYDALYSGKRSEAPEDAATATVVDGTPIYAPEGSSSYVYNDNNYTWSDGTGVPYGYSYRLEFDKATLESLLNDTSNEDIYFVMRYTSHYVDSKGSTDSASTWSGKKDQYLTLSNVVRNPDTLSITNETKMFKASAAQLVYAKDGSATLELTIGSAYHYVLVGTYEQAVEIGDNTSKWIAGTASEDGKAYTFEIPVAEGQTKIPLISISNSRYENYKAGTGTLENAFMPRLLVIDYDNLTLTTGDYSSIESCTIKDCGTGIANGTEASIEVLGGPSSNNYKYAVSFKLASKYDRVFVGTAADAAKAEDTALITPAADGSITLDPKDEGAKSTMASGVATVIAVRNASTGTWEEYAVTPSLLDNTVSLDKVYTIDEVKALIEKLPSFEKTTAADETQIVTAERAYDVLSADDQATLDKEVSKNGYTYSTMQPYGRVLESAVWALETLKPVDNKTTLAEGIYNANSGLASQYSKGKSTSPRVRPWSVKSISVDAEGNATAAITVDSDGYTYVSMGGEKYYNQAPDGENCVFYVPIDPSGKLYFGGYSTSMKCEIGFTLDCTLPTTATPIDGSALASALGAANAAYSSANISDDGSECKIGDKYVPTAEAAKLEAAIKTANGVLYGNKSTKEDMDDAVAALDAAVEAFNAAGVEVKDLGWTRVSGEGRSETAAQVAAKGWESSETAILTTAWNYPDALAASAIAGTEDCPILLTETESLPTATLNELVSLGVKHVAIMGGTAAVSNDVEKAVQAIGIETERVSGETREDTSVKAMARVAESNPNFDTVIVAYGYNFPDALAISPYAYAASAPIVLTHWDNQLDDATVAAIKSYDNVKNVIIVGGTAAVSDSVKDQLGDGYSYQRLSGETRYETSKAIAEFEIAAVDANGEKLFNASNPAVATGDTYPDALTGGAFCGHRQSILVLANDSNMSDAIDVLSSQKASRVQGVVLGGDKAVSDLLYKAIEEGTK